MNAASKAIAPKRRGLFGALFLIFFLIGAGALAFDLVMGSSSGAFWIGAQPGGRAAIGVGAAVFVVIAARLARLVLTRRMTEHELEGGRDAGDHA